MILPSSYTSTLLKIRYFHVHSRSHGSQIKEKLSYLEKYNNILNKSSNELKRLNIKKQIKLKRLHKSAYPKYQALDIIRKKYPEFQDTFHNNKINIGPTTNNDLQILSRTKDKRLIYSILGITGEQLRDSKLIDKDVNKFLERGQLEKALYLVKLAKGKSGSGMDSIIRYYLYKLQLPKQVLSLHLWRKKNKIPFTKYSYTIFFDGMAKQPTLLSKSLGKALFNIVENVIKERQQQKEEQIDNSDIKISIIEFNAMLNGLANCEDPTYALKLFNKLNDHIPILKDCRSAIYDPMSLTYLFKAIGNIKDQVMFIEAFNNAISSINGIKLDAPLCFQIAKTLGSCTKDKSICRQSLVAIEKYFDIYKENDPNMPSMNHSVIKLPSTPADNKKIDLFQVNPSVAGYYIKQCYDLKYYSKGLKFIETFLLEKHPDLMDITNVYYYMNLTIMQYPTTCASRCISIYEKYLSKDKAPNKHGIVTIYNAFLKESKKHFVIKDPKKLNEFLFQLNAFITKWDSQCYKIEKRDGSIILYNKDSWKFIIKILSNIKDCGGEIPLIEQNRIVIEYLKCLLYDTKFQMKTLSTKEYEKEKFLELGVIKIINDVIESNKIPDFKDDATKENQLQFYLRRHLLRLKNKLLIRISYFENRLRVDKNKNKFKIDLDSLSEEIKTLIILSIRDLEQDIKQRSIEMSSEDT